MALRILSYSVLVLCWFLFPCNLKATTPPVFKSKSTATSSSSNSGISISKPSGTVSGDFLIAVVSTDDDQGFYDASGWELLSQGHAGYSSGGSSVGIYYKFAGNSEPSSYYFSWDGGEQATGAVLRYEGVDLSYPIDVLSFQNGNSYTPTAPSVTTNFDNTEILYLFASDDDESPVTHPSGTTERVDIESSANTLGIADKSQLTAGVVSQGVFDLAGTSSSEGWIAYTIALVPEADACEILRVNYTTLCNNSGTTDIFDDSYKIGIQPIGIGLSSTYNISVSYGGNSFSKNNISYSELDTLSINIDIGTYADVTITDGVTGACQFTKRVLSPSECSSEIQCWAVSDEGNPDRLFKYSSLTGAWTNLGSTGINGIEAVAFNPFNNTIYTFNNDQFGTLNPVNGVFSSIGSPIGTISGPNGNYNISDIDGLAFDPFTGVLWGSERKSGNDYLIQVNINNGAIIPDAFGPGNDYAVAEEVFDNVLLDYVYDLDDIAIDPTNGNLYAISNDGGSGGTLSIINKSDGTVKEVVGNFQGIDDMEALGFYNNGQLYGSTGNNAPDVNDKNRFFQIEKYDASLEELAFIDPTNSQKDFEACDCLTGPANKIQGTVYEDDNRNTIQDPGESGTSGVSVFLVQDVNGNGIYDSSAEILDEQITDSNGDYTFNVSATGYFLVFIDEGDLPSGDNLTTDNSETASFFTGGICDDDNDFGHNSDCSSAHSGTETYTGCSGDGYQVTVNGTIYNESNSSGTETLQSQVDGCDSIVTITLTFQPIPDPGSDILVICPSGGGAAPSFYNFNLPGNWSVINSPSGSSVSITGAGEVTGMDEIGVYIFEIVVAGCSEQVEIEIPECCPVPECVPISVVKF